MHINKSKYEKLMKNIDELNYIFTKKRVGELAELLGNRKELVIRNFLSGIFKGIGIGIGFSIITAIIVIILRKIVTLNIPVIGDYIADIVEIVNRK